MTLYCLGVNDMKKYEYIDEIRLYRFGINIALGTVVSWSSNQFLEEDMR